MFGLVPPTLGDADLGILPEFGCSTTGSNNGRMEFLTAHAAALGSAVGPLDATGGLLAQDDSTLFLGEDFWPWMILAFGAAMVVGNVLALLRPPDGGVDVTEAPGRSSQSGEQQRPRPPLGRTVVLIAVGLAAAAWGIASLLA